MTLDAATHFERARASRWGLSPERFRSTLEASVRQSFPDSRAAAAEVERYLRGLHLEDLALACACAAGLEPAWDHFIREYRPILYRAADAIDPSGGARDLADGLYADLFGLKERNDERQSLFRYFHGRSSLATWLRAVLSQRVVDRARERQRTKPLDDDEVGLEARATVPLPSLEPADPDRTKHLSMVRLALVAAIAALSPSDRLRLSLYYEQDMTLAAIGRVLREHEATASRHLTRVRDLIRRDVKARLRRDHQLDDRTLAECLQSAVGDAGSLNLDELMPARKSRGRDRSI